MRKGILTFLTVFLFVTIAGCNFSVTPGDGNGGQISFFNVNDIFVKQEKNKTINVSRGISASIGSDDVSSDLTYTIYDKYGEKDIEGTTISTANPATYQITVTYNKDGINESATRNIIVGGGVPIDRYAELSDMRYSLFWSDEFDEGTQPNEETWTYEIGTGSGGWGNGEKQYYTSNTDNIFIEDGILNIVLLKDANGRAYSSARIKTQNKFAFRYGYIEARIKVPTGNGTWPAFWMLPNESTNGTWPTSGEIDIMEHTGNRYGRIDQTLHFGTQKGSVGNYYHTQQGRSTQTGDVTTTFHTYGLEWRPDRITFYVDQVETYTYNIRSRAKTFHYLDWPFDREFFIILNLAYGGNYMGNIFDDTIFDDGGKPTMKVDYIRIYKSEVITKIYES